MTSWNPWHGCHKISEGCENCYMHFLDAKFGRDGNEIKRSSSNFALPLVKRRDGSYKLKSGETVYVCLASDFFLEDADHWRNEVWSIIAERRDVTFVIITKRSARIWDCLPDSWGDGWENVYINVTAENQRRADERLPAFLELPTRHHGISVTPMLGEMDLSKYLSAGIIDEVSAGGENYDGARVCRFEWIEKLREQCVRYGVRFNFFDTGEFFERDGKVYRIPFKLRHEQAARSGLSYDPRKDTDGSY